jgi:hypothetical protein
MALINKAAFTFVALTCLKNSALLHLAMSVSDEVLCAGCRGPPALPSDEVETQAATRGGRRAQTKGKQEGNGISCHVYLARLLIDHALVFAQINLKVACLKLATCLCVNA